MRRRDASLWHYVAGAARQDAYLLRGDGGAQHRLRIDGAARPDRNLHGARCSRTRHARRAGVLSVARRVRFPIIHVVVQFRPGYPEVPDMAPHLGAGVVELVAPHGSDLGAARSALRARLLRNRGAQCSQFATSFNGGGSILRFFAGSPLDCPGAVWRSGSQAAGGERMKWVTTANVHFDRVASPWLIKRFVDPNAEFVFVARDAVDTRPKDAIPLAIPGTKLGPHDENGTTFTKILREYKLDDPALKRMADVVEKGVGFVLNGYRPTADDRDGQIGVGFLAFSDGMILFKKNDQERLDASFVAYDALYALFKANKGLSLVARDEIRQAGDSGRA
jgi:hypothetical protein